MRRTIGWRPDPRLGGKIARAIQYRPMPKVRRWLEQLQATGFYGFSLDEVVDRLVCQKLIDLIHERSALVEQDPGKRP